MTPPPAFQRHFLPSDEALLPCIANYLLKLGDELRHTLVIVPTAHSGRRLRRFLPEIAGRPILAPLVQTPESAFRPVSGSPAAPKLLWWAAWAETVKVADPSLLRPLFPEVETLSRDSHWALSTARQFTQLKDELAEIDCGFAHTAKFSEEPERWLALEALDQAAIARLKQWGAYCPAESKRQTAVHWSPPADCKRIVLAAVPDAVPLSIRAWQNAVGQVPIDILIHADHEIADHFDDWGKPLPEAWKTTNINFWGDDTDWLNLSPGPHQAAHQTVESCAELDSESVALGIADKAFGPATAEAFSESGWECYDPDGRSLSSLGIWSTLRSLRQLIADPNQFREVPDLLKSPEAPALLELASPLSCARDIDRLTVDSIPQTLSSAIAAAESKKSHPYHPELIEGLHNLDTLLRSARPGKGLEWLGGVLDRLERAPTFPEELKNNFANALDALAQLGRHNSNLPVTEAMDLLLAQVESTRIANDRVGTAIDQLGWLELAYQNSPHLRIVGLHEGLVPDRPTDNGFLTEILRAKLGLRDRAQREARDAYLLNSFVQSRRKEGSVRIFISQADSAGNARQPSRLLLRCPAEQLSDRVMHCFREDLDDAQRVPSYSRGQWHLKIPEGPMVYSPDKPWTLSPSLMRSYLRCPLRFYLERQVGFRRKEFDKRELDAMDFGNLVHGVLEDYGRDEQMRQLASETEINTAFEDLLSDRFSRSFGPRPNLALTIQRESIRRRLSHFASAQAQAFNEGWRIESVELAIGPGDGETPWEHLGRAVKMRIDRIDLHCETGQRRLIDYKSGKAKSPAEGHLENLRASEDNKFLYADPAPNAGGRARSERRWKDLQLPLYAEYARKTWGELPELAYINLPTSASDTGFSVWKGYDDLHDNALAWMQGIVEAIEDGHFEEREQPTQTKNWDPFTALAPDSLSAAFDLE